MRAAIATEYVTPDGVVEVPGESVIIVGRTTLVHRGGEKVLWEK